MQGHRHRLTVYPSLHPTASMRKVPNANANLFLNTRYSRQAARRRSTCRQNTSARNRPRSNSTRARGTIYQQKPINNTAEINDAGVLLGLATRKVTISRRRPATSHSSRRPLKMTPSIDHLSLRTNNKIDPPSLPTGLEGCTNAWYTWSPIKRDATVRNRPATASSSSPNRNHSKSMGSLFALELPKPALELRNPKNKKQSKQGLYIYNSHRPWHTKNHSSREKMHSGIGNGSGNAGVLRRGSSARRGGGYSSYTTTFQTSQNKSSLLSSTSIKLIDPTRNGRKKGMKKVSIRNILE